LATAGEPKRCAARTVCVRLTLVPADRDLAYADHGDAALGALVAEHDGRALEALYDRYGTACYSLAKRIVVDPQLAQDVVQEVFLTLWRNAGRFDGERGSLSTYLLSITHHKAVDAVRKEERQRTRRAPAEVLELTESGQDVDEEAWTSLRRSKVRTALATLPDPLRHRAQSTKRIPSPRTPGSSPRWRRASASPWQSGAEWPLPNPAAPGPPRPRA
jgi:RNA polymerase sigma factor (sigma-70 family)